MRSEEGVHAHADGMPAADEFHTMQLWLLLAGRVDEDDLHRVIDADGVHEARERLEAALAASDGEPPAELLPAARAFVEAVASGNAPPARGESREDAVAVGEVLSEPGIALEYEWLDWRFGERDVEWWLERRGSGVVDGVRYDWFEVRLPDGRECRIEFDITSFYGLWESGRLGGF